MRKIMIAGLAAAAPLVPANAQMTPPQMHAPILPEGTLLDVVAEGRTTRVPDIATIRTGVVTQASTAAAALADNAVRMGRVLAALKRAGVAATDIETAAATLSPQYRYGENQPPVITGYQVSNTLSIRFRAIAQSGAILDILVAQGANQIDGPTLALADPDTALDEARSDAVRRARLRADLYARAAGLSVARIVSISESGGQQGAPGPVMYVQAKEAATTQILPGESRVTATISVRFLLK